MKICDNADDEDNLFLFYLTIDGAYIQVKTHVDSLCAWSNRSPRIC
jgi:hypothetical protein